MNKIFIKSKYLKMIQAIFKEHCPTVQVLAYGSRVNGSVKDAHSGSDLDLLVIGLADDNIPFAKLKEMLNELNIPFLIDIFTLENLPQSFHAHIMQNHIELFPNFTAQCLNEVDM